MQFFSGSEAFRRYNWLKAVPATNAAGNLRGMVINAKARVVFNYSTRALEKLSKYDKMLVLAGTIIELGKEADHIKAIATSNATTSEKASRLCLIGSMAILRSLTGLAPTATHLVAMSLEGYVQLAGLATGRGAQAQTVVRTLQAADTRISALYSEVLDADNAYAVINTYF